jgi:hypothetical protein
MCRRVEEVDHWIELPIYDIQQSYGDRFFDGCGNPLNIDDLEEMPILDDAGFEIPIYADGGYQIQRRLGAHDPNVRPHGVLMNLYDIDKLIHPAAELENYCTESLATAYTVYPQAGLVTAGHFQANGLIAPFVPLLEGLNKEVQIQGDNYDEDANAVPIIGVGCQGYNALLHATRGRCAQHHDAQRGLVTGALAGLWAKTTSNKNKAKTLQIQCTNRLPHIEFQKKISNDDAERPPLDCSLRLENTFVVHMERLAAEHRNGRYVKYHLRFVLYVLR